MLWVLLAKVIPMHTLNICFNDEVLFFFIWIPLLSTVRIYYYCLYSQDVSDKFITQFIYIKGTVNTFKANNSDIEDKCT